VQPLGVTLPIPGPASGVWAEEQSTRLGGVFDRIFRVLCDARPELLARENDAAKLPGAYEFPREFKKLRGSLVQLLVDLCRPSQLTVGPFLRGFYFSGVRPVIVQEAAQGSDARAPEPQARQDAREATAMFRTPVAGQAAAAAPLQRVAVSRKVPQWLFLTHFFDQVLLADRVAMGASGSSAKTDLLRRVLLVFAAVLCLVFCIGFTVSFFLNRGLEGQVHTALQGTILPPAAANLASVDSLRSLEALRQSLETLTAYDREGAPLRYRWGLYVGSDLYPDVRRLYFTRFKALLFGQTQNALAAFLSGLPQAPGPATPAYDQAYDALKAYLITTANHDKSTREFLSPVLMKTWSANATVDPERLQLAQKQFDFYSDELKLGSPYTAANDQTAVAKARNYLKQFGDQERIYKAMKAGAPKATVNFNRQIGGSKDYVVDGYDVAGPFTKDGWKFMSDAIRNPSRYVHGEQWVLGDQGAVNADPHELIRPLLSLYEAEYIKEWRTYLRSAALVKYKDLKDAADKLTMLSGGQSPLLALFALASQNIPWDDPEIAKALQPVLYLEPPGNDRYTNPQNNGYVGALIKLQTDVDAVATSPAGTDSPAANQAISDARDAKNTTNQLATQNFNPDPERLVQNLLLEPITNVEVKLRGVGADELNAGGKGLCGQFRAVLSKYPFNPASKQDASVDEVNSILKKPDGALWKFYEDNLKKFLAKQSNQYVPVPGANVTLSQRFVDFFNQAAAFSDFLYAGGPDPHFTYTLKPVPTETVQRIGLDIDTQKLDYTGGTPAAKQFTWQAGGTHEAKGTYGADGVTFETQAGTWAIFRMFGDADKSPAAGGAGEYDWIIRQGKAGAPSMVNGKPVTVRLQLDMTGPPVFQKGFFSRLACVAEVAKP
jgi:type VI secretion system protein ImpL